MFRMHKISRYARNDRGEASLVGSFNGKITVRDNILFCRQTAKHS